MSANEDTSPSEDLTKNDKNTSLKYKYKLHTEGDAEVNETSPSNICQPDSRLDKLEENMSVILQYIKHQENAKSSEAVPADDAGADHTYRAPHVNTDDILDLYPSEDGGFTDSSQDGGQLSKPRRKRTSKESNRDLQDDIDSLLQKSCKTAKSPKPSVLDSFDTPEVLELGDPVGENLNNILTKYWTVSNESQVNTIREGYKIPSNTIDKLIVPLINDETYRRMDPFIKRRDKKVRLVQDNNSATTVAQMRITEEVLRAEEDNTAIDGKEVIKHTLNAFSLMGSNNKFLTTHRKKIMAHKLPPILQEVCHNGEIPSASKYLFGDDISKTLKDAQERMQLNAQLTKTQNYSRNPNSHTINNNNNNNSKRRKVHFNVNNQQNSYANLYPASSTSTSSTQKPRQQDFRRGPYNRGRKKGQYPSYKQ